MKKGKLYIVATPIGNLGDISLRALEILKEVDCIFAEDTRVTKKLLNHFDIKTPLDKYNQHSSDKTKDKILSFLTRGESVALVSDAGTPNVSDPGGELVDYLLERTSLEMIPIPGVSSVSAALSVCGFDVSHHIFIGFFPKKKKDKLTNWIKESKLAFVYFDSPHRVIKNLEYLQNKLGERRVFVAREMTKLHETFYRGSFNEVLNQLREMGTIKGEITVVIEKPQSKRV